MKCVLKVLNYLKKKTTKNFVVYFFELNVIFVRIANNILNSNVKKRKICFNNVNQIDKKTNRTSHSFI